jgi:hypothetical protein
MTAEDMSGTGKSLLRTTSDARSYDGQYAPWVQALAGEANHDIRTSADELNTLGQRLGCVAKAFEDADQAESVGDFAWALIMREMVERGEIPTGDWFVWRERFVRPPWISPEEWRLLTPEERRELVLEARKAYDAQNARIARMRTPPWEKDLGWLWNIAGLHPLLFEMEHFPDMEIDGIREYMNQLRQEYEQHWADFLANQAVYKFGVGDDLTEAFLIYMFGLEGAMQYGAAAIESSKGEFIGVIVAEDQRITEPFRERLSRDGINIIDLDRNAQDFNLNAIPGFENNNYGSNRMGEKGVHFNLCGQIGSALMMEVDPVEALIVFEGIPGGSDILENPHEGTNPNDLIALLAEYGWEGERVGYTGDPYPWRRFNGDSFRPKYEQIADHLLNGRGINALVNLDTGSDYIEPLDRTADAGHWSPILQVMTTRDDQQLVRLYNPYQDREEWYTFEHLVKSWTPSANYMAVVATPPEELRWLPNP